jgi:enoyl-CoA hydratase/carnithine racemase
MLFTGAALSADRAFQLGVVNEVVPKSELMSRCDIFFQGITRGDRQMIARGKALANQNTTQLLRPLYEQASGLMATTLFTPSAQRRIQPKID